jgi:hypothetical protein
VYGEDGATFILANCALISLASLSSDSLKYLVNDTSKPWAAKVEVVGPFVALETVLFSGASFVWMI